jgi:hypothetical protein
MDHDDDFLSVDTPSNLAVMVDGKSKGVVCGTRYSFH